jgi:diaminopimelate epimerase
MLVHFAKYHGTGNDFIIVDNRQLVIHPDNGDLIRTLCDRRFGIGADGFMLLSNHDQYDFEMQYFNRDGSPGSLCGNGARCIALFAKRLGLVDSQTSFSTYDGLHMAQIRDDQVTVHMGDVKSVVKETDHYFLDTGSPHAVFFRDDVRTMDMDKEAPVIRYHKMYAPDGTNVNYVRKENSKIYVRTWERGVEAETLSCGTGVVAASICAVKAGIAEKLPIEIITPGGQLLVDMKRIGEQEFTNIVLTGPAAFVFEGEIEI